MKFCTQKLLILLILVAALNACSAPKNDPAIANQVNDFNVAYIQRIDKDFAEFNLPQVDTIITNGVGGSVNLAPLVPTSDGPGCAVGLVQGDEIIYLRAFGMASLQADEQWTLGTVSPVGSISKSFTALAIMKMDEDGLININSTVGTYLSTTGALRTVMVRDLLSHSSGAGGASSGAAFAPNWEVGSPPRACPSCEYVSRAISQPRIAFGFYEGNETVVELDTPNDADLTTGIYSNVGYSVLGAIVDQVGISEPAGHGYEKYIWHLLANRGDMYTLALTHSWRLDDIPNYARGYNADGDLIDTWDTVGSIEGWEGPAGGWTMTIGDLSRFIIALERNQFVSASTLDEMSTPRSDTLGGYGLSITVESDPYRKLWHGGDIGGYAAVWTWWPDLEAELGVPPFGVALMCNSNKVNAFRLETYAQYILNNVYLADAGSDGSIPLPVDGLGSAVISSPRGKPSDRGSLWFAQ